MKNPLTSILNKLWPITPIVRGVHWNLTNPTMRRHSRTDYYADTEMFRFFPLPGDAGVSLEVGQRHMALSVSGTGYRRLNWREVSLLAQGIKEWEKDPGNLFVITTSPQKTS